MIPIDNRDSEVIYLMGIVASDTADVCDQIWANALRAPRARERSQSSLSPPDGLRPLSQEHPND